MKSVVDLGCGVATKLMKLFHPICKYVAGVDQAEAIDYCRKTYTNGHFLEDDFEDPKVKHGPYDLVIVADVIEHLSNPDALVRYIKLLSHKNSYIVISTPERDILRGKECTSSEKPEHVREWNSTEFKCYLQSKEFEIIKQMRIPFCRFSFNKEVYKVIKAIKKRCHTTKTTQLAICKLAG